MFIVPGAWKNKDMQHHIVKWLEDATFIFYYKIVYSHDDDKSNEAKDIMTMVVSSLSVSPSHPRPRRRVRRLRSERTVLYA